jgi:hypothetical protein
VVCAPVGAFTVQVCVANGVVCAPVGASTVSTARFGLCAVVGVGLWRCGQGVPGGGIYNSPDQVPSHVHTP